MLGTNYFKQARLTEHDAVGVLRLGNPIGVK
jgi:hypothetical protein